MNDELFDILTMTFENYIEARRQRWAAIKNYEEEAEYYCWREIETEENCKSALKLALNDYIDARVTMLSREAAK